MAQQGARCNLHEYRITKGLQFLTPRNGYERTRNIQGPFAPPPPWALPLCVSSFSPPHLVHLSTAYTKLSGGDHQAAENNVVVTNGEALILLTNTETRVEQTGSNQKLPHRHFFQSAKAYLKRFTVYTSAVCFWTFTNYETCAWNSKFYKYKCTRLFFFSFFLQ